MTRSYTFQPKSFPDGFEVEFTHVKSDKDSGQPAHVEFEGITLNGKCCWQWCMDNNLLDVDKLTEEAWEHLPACLGGETNPDKNRD